MEEIWISISKSNRLRWDTVFNKNDVGKSYRYNIYLLHSDFMIIRNIANVFKKLCLVKYNVGSLPLSFYKCPRFIWTSPLWSFGCKFGSNSQGYNVFNIWRILLLSYFISEMKTTYQRLFDICWLFTIYRPFLAIYKPCFPKHRRSFSPTEQIQK